MKKKLQISVTLAEKMNIFHAMPGVVTALSVTHIREQLMQMTKIMNSAIIVSKKKVRIKMTDIKYFCGIPARKMKPTKQHRPAMWECMLGAVYAMNTDGEIKYFDYRYEAAAKWAGVNDSEADCRLFRMHRHCTWSNGKMDHAEPSFKQLVLWRLK